MFAKILNKSAATIFASVAIMTATAATTFALGASPLRVEYSGHPGDIVEGQLTVRNTTDEPRLIKISTSDFMVNNETESLLFIDGRDTGYAHSLKDWFILPENDLTIGPKEKKIIPYKIQISEGAQSKGYYGALFVESAPLNREQSTAGVSINLNVRVAHLVLLKVEGNLREKVAIQNFMVIKDSEDSAMFEIVMENNGNVHSSPEGIIEVIDKNGNIVQKLPINEGKHNILPSSKKTYKTDFKLKDLKPGIYTAVFTGYTENKDKLQAKTVIELTNDREITVHETSIGEVDISALRSAALKQSGSFPYITIIALTITALILCIAYNIRHIFKPVKASRKKLRKIMRKIHKSTRK